MKLDTCWVQVNLKAQIFPNPALEGKNNFSLICLRLITAGVGLKQGLLIRGIFKEFTLVAQCSTIANSTGESSPCNRCSATNNGKQLPKYKKYKKYGKYKNTTKMKPEKIRPNTKNKRGRLRKFNSNTKRASARKETQKSENNMELLRNCKLQIH